MKAYQNLLRTLRKSLFYSDKSFIPTTTPSPFNEVPQTQPHEITVRTGKGTLNFTEKLCLLLTP